MMGLVIVFAVAEDLMLDNRPASGQMEQVDASFGLRQGVVTALAPWWSLTHLTWKNMI